MINENLILNRNNSILLNKQFIKVTLLLLIFSFVFTPHLVPLPEGLSVESEPKEVTSIDFLYDLTYEKNKEIIHEQVIFDKVFELIESAKKYVIVDMFLFNDDYDRKDNYPNISEKLTKSLIEQKQKYPDLKVIFITDPVNTCYGSYESKFLERLKENGINVVLTDLTKLPDSNPSYSTVWRNLFKDLNTYGKGYLPNPFSSDSPEVKLSSYLELLNFKANHRKVLITENKALVSSANPHDASGFHSNIAFVIEGEIINDLIEAERAVAKFSGYNFAGLKYENDENIEPIKNTKVTLLTEGKIRKHLLKEFEATQKGDFINIGMFYLSERSLVKELINASKRGVNIRIVLDANKDAFGREKNGIPNRQVAYELVKKSEGKIKIKWYKTHGEQFHSKLISIQKENDHVIFGGSANLTKRNIGNFNLEKNLKIETIINSEFSDKIISYFDKIWDNQAGIYTLEYEKYQEDSLFKYSIYRILEWSGFYTV